AAAGALGGEKRIEKFRQDFRRDSNPVVLHRGSNAISGTAETDLDAAGGSRFADGLLGVADEIQENLNELVGVADDGGQTGDGLELDFNIVAAERMILKLQRAVNNHVEVQRLFLRRGGP